MKGQVSIIQFSLLVLFSIAFLSAIFVLSQHIQETSTDEFNKYHIDNIATRIKENIVEMRILFTDSNAESITKTISIPEKIGPNEYLIRGNGTDLVFQTFGGNSVIRRVPIYYWDITLDGQVFSSNGKLKLSYPTDTPSSVKIS